MADKRVQDFVAKTTPVPADLIYGADSSDAFREVKFQVGNLISALGPALQSIAALTTSSNQMIYTTSADTYAVAALTPFARAVLDDIDAATMRDTIGLKIGGDVQAYNSALQSIAELITASDKMLYTTANNTYTTTDLTPYARTILAALDAPSVRTLLGLAIGINVQAYNTALQSIANLTTIADKIIYTTGANSYATTDLSSLSRELLSLTTSAQMRKALGLIIGTDVEPFSPALSSIAALTTANNKMIYTTAPDVYATTDLSVFARGLLGLTRPDQVTSAIHALPLTGGVVTGAIRYSTFPFSGDELVNKNYVDAVSSGGKTPAVAATTGNLNGWVYENGVGGTDATLTAPSNGVFTTDDVTPIINDRIFVPHQTDPITNGMYVLTQVGNAFSRAILTRSKDYDIAAKIHQGDRFTVLNGTLYATTDWLQTIAVTDVGSDPINFTQFGTAYLAKANNLSDVSSASASRMNLGLKIGADVQAYDAALQSIAGLTTVANKMIYTTAPDSYSTTNLTPFARNLLGSIDANDAQNTLTLVPGTDVQIQNANLDVLSSGLTDGQILIGATGNQVAKTTITAGDNITITNSPGTITIASTGSGSSGLSDIFMMMGA